ncbi:MAG: helix-turn-helix transcriptional regulator [bacterium]
MKMQEEIKQLLRSHGIHITWLAEKLEMKSHTLIYLLNESTDFDEDLYKQINKIVENYQYELMLYEIDEKQERDLFTEEELSLGIGDRIRIFAKRKYGNLKKLADAMAISPQQLQQYISGKREPGTRILVKLLRLGCSVNWLLGGSESSESYKIMKLENELRKHHEGYQQVMELIQKLQVRH